MKKLSTFKKYSYLFDFFIDTVTETKDTGTFEKIAFVSTIVQSADKSSILWSGSIRVRMNEFGIYPFPEDIKKITGTDTLKKMLIVEIRRYIKPQKAFL
jgi:hypothetical protein